MIEPSVYVVKCLIDCGDLGWNSSRHTCVLSQEDNEILIKKSVVSLSHVDIDVTGILNDAAIRSVKKLALGAFRVAESSLSNSET